MRGLRRILQKIPAAVLSPDFGIGLGWSVAVCGSCMVLASPVETHGLVQHLGGEYFNIAQALVDGRGFSDPFGERTGPTAWMPPLYAWLLWMLLGLLELRGSVATAVLILTCGALSATGMSLYSMAKRSAVILPPFVILILFAAWLFSFRLWFFIMTTDVWFLSTLATAVLSTIFDYVQTNEVRRWRWGLLGGATALASPTMGVALIVLLGAFWLRDRLRRAKWLFALALSWCLAAPWMIRNALVFDRLIPFKSNLLFEAYQGNVLDQDGVYDRTTMGQHPFSHIRHCFEYTQLGETAYVEQHGQKFRTALRADPGGFIRKVANRLQSATLLYVPLMQSDGPIVLMLQRTMYALPWVAFGASVWLRGRNKRLIRVLAGFLFIYLLPYIVIAFYGRYIFPVTPVLLLLGFLGLDGVVAAALNVRVNNLIDVPPINDDP